MPEFKVGDVIQHPQGGAKYRIVLIEEAECAYKVVRLDNGFITCIGVNKGYVLTSPPPGETTFQVGQVLLRKMGDCYSAPICIVVKCTPSGGNSKFNVYEVIEIQRCGEGFVETERTYLEHELLNNYTTKNLKWLLFHGSPLKIAEKHVKKRVDDLEREIQQKIKEKKEMEELQANLKFFERKEDANE